DEVTPLNMPVDFSRPEMQDFEGNTTAFYIDASELKQLKQLALEEKATLYIVLNTIFYIFLSKLCNQEDIVVGTPMLGRKHAELQEIIGMFVNSIALRNYPSGEKKVRRFLREVKEDTLKAFENQDYPFEELVENLAVRREPGRNPLFDVTFGLLNIELNTDDLSAIEIPGLKLIPSKYERRTSLFDLGFEAREQGDKLFFKVEYRTKLFKPVTINRFIGYFKKTVSSIPRFVDEKISSIEIISEAEKKQVLFDFNQTELKYPEDKTIAGLFENQAQKTPANTAVIEAHTKHSLSYADLNEKAGKLAFLIKEKGVSPGSVIGLMVESSLEMIVGLFAILKAGGAYLPISPHYPEERVRYFLKDSGAPLLLTLKKYTGEIDFPGVIIDLKAEESFSREEQLTPSVEHAPGDPVYVIYTSGST
ncbi:MAG: AMP-binding protein, partial [bacterium]|nr:AMP-binding protein [bacterium]